MNIKANIWVYAAYLPEDELIVIYIISPYKLLTSFHG